jgi:uncharacterized lipoprotein YmbA
MYRLTYIELFVKSEAKKRNAQKIDVEQIVQVVKMTDPLETSEVYLHTNDGKYSVLRIEVQAKCRAQ